MFNRKRDDTARWLPNGSWPLISVCAGIGLWAAVIVLVTW